ncbi:hypothetical protein [Streptomyces sp. NPDC059575]|uniref:hypothetical protein n=1 Tax=Streptomyces sp. NPDC059575 TaxID=3346872 RepID=UPI00368EFD1A
MGTAAHRDTRRRGRLAGLVAALGLTAALLTTTVPAAHAAPQAMGRCTTTSGVVLAVDFSHWGGPVLRSCGTTPTTGYELLNQGGWQTTGTGHDGPAFICRIGYGGYQGGRQYPTFADDGCVLTPPASAYWSYWHADPGAKDWTYSQLGAMLYRPKPGSVDLWIFGGTNIEGTRGRPQVSPDQLRAHNTAPQGDGGKPASTAKAPPLPPDVDTGPAPERRSAQPPRTAPAVPKPPVKQPDRRPTAPHTSTATHSSEVAPKPTKSASSPPSPTATPTPPVSVKAAPTTRTKVVDAAPAAEARHDSGSVLPVAAAGGLVVLIGGAAVFEARRRRRTE